MVERGRKRGRPRKGDEQLNRVGGNRNPVYRAVFLLGGLQQTAAILGVTREVVWTWVRGRHVVKTRHALALSALTDVPIADLAPLDRRVRRRIASMRGAA